MPRRARPTARRSSSPSRWLFLIAGILALGIVVALILAPTLVTNYIRAYVRKDEFRQKAEQMVAAATGGEARLAPLVWHDDAASVSELKVEGAGGWDFDASNLHASLDFGAIRSGLWSIQNAGADEITLRHVPPTTGLANANTSNTDAGNEPDSTAEQDQIPSFLRRYIPNRTEVSGFDVQRFFFEQGGWKLAETRLHLGDWSSGEKSMAAKLSGGTLQTPVTALEQKQPLKLDLTQGALRIGDGQVQLSNATLRWKQQSEATVRGHVKTATGAWQTFTRVRALPLDEFLNDWWKQRLTGQIEGDVEVSGSRIAPTTWKANAELKNGLLQGLPILEKLVKYTNIHRFNRVVLDICTASLKPEGDALLVDKIVVQSNGLLRIEGALTFRGRNIEGDLFVGVTPEALAALPGASNRVFTGGNPNGPPGLQWTRVHVAGTLDAPQEDLSSRLIGAAGMTLLFDTPEKLVNGGAETLLKPVLGEDAAKMPGKVIEGATGVIENGVKTGAGLLNKVLPLFPGK